MMFHLLGSDWRGLDWATPRLFPHNQPANQRPDEEVGSAAQGIDQSRQRSRGSSRHLTIQRGGRESRNLDAGKGVKVKKLRFKLLVQIKMFADAFVDTSSSAFSLFGVGASSFQSPHSPVLRSFYLYSFLLHVFPCPPTSIFCVLITTSSSVSLSTWPNHLSIASLVSHLCLPYLPLLLWLNSWPSQSSLFPSSNAIQYGKSYIKSGS